MRFKKRVSLDDRKASFISFIFRPSSSPLLQSELQSYNGNTHSRIDSSFRNQHVAEIADHPFRGNNRMCVVVSPRAIANQVGRPRFLDTAIEFLFGAAQQFRLTVHS
jgi:hypothetical protein